MYVIHEELDLVVKLFVKRMMMDVCECELIHEPECTRIDTQYSHRPQTK